MVLHSHGVWVLTFILVVVFPIMDYLLYFRLRTTMHVYVWNIVAEWSLVAACLWVIRRHGWKLADFGVQLASAMRMLATVGALAVVIAVIAIMNKNKGRGSSPEVRKAAERVRKLLPSNRTERTMFIAVALTAGICEEFLYRGWLFAVVRAAGGSIWVALVISSIVFGFAHVYQGRKGVIGASVLGGVFGGVFIASVSLFPGQVLHALIDVNNGLALGKVVDE